MDRHELTPARATSLAQTARRVVVQVLAFCAVPLSFAAGAPPRLWLSAEDRILFVGPTGFEQRRFTAMVETYVTLRWPRDGVRFAHSGIVNAFGATESFNPGMVVVDAASEQAFCTESASRITRVYIDYLSRTAVSRPETRLLLVLPRECEASQTAREQLASAVASFSNGLGVQHRLPPQTSASGLDSDATRAREVINAWALSSDPVQVEINAHSGRAFSTANTQVHELATDRWILWSQDDAQVGLPPEMTSHGFADLNQRYLRVVGLAGQHYRLTIDGKDYGVFARSALDTGLSLGNAPTPSSNRGSLVYLNILHRLKTWCDEQERPGSAERKAGDSEVLTTIAESAQPKRHDYELQPVD